MRPPRLVFCFLSCAIVLSLSSAARAEVPPSGSPRDETGFAVYVFGGHTGWEASPLEAPLAAMGYSSFSPDPGTGGVGLRAWTHGWTGALELQFAMSDATAGDGRTLALVSGQYMLEAGRVLAATKHLQTYVMAGVGCGSSSIAPDRKSLAPHGEPNALSEGRTVESTALALQALAGVEYHLAFPGKKRGFNGFLVGLRAGYNVQAEVSSWSASNGSGGLGVAYPVDLPRVAQDGPFVHLVIGDIAVGR
jgi:hypothetical protein